MAIRILCFGALTDVIGKSEWTKVIPRGMNLVGLTGDLEMEWPALQGSSYRIAVNQTFATGEVILKEGDEIALLPPFAGG